MLDLVVFYSRNLAVPARRDVDDPQVLAGKQQFYAAGCTACHRPKYVTRRLPDQPEQSFQLIWPYTDLLLHDMGNGLADNRPEGDADGREWRTPPLWGIGLTELVSGHTQFLHDGRARNLLEAILWHGGEAEAAKQRVVAMPTADREALLRFLGSLKSVRRRSPMWLRALSLMFAIFAGSAWAAPVPDASYRDLNATLMDRYLLPRYGALALAADGFAEATQGLCQAPGEMTLQAARSAYHATMDAWMAVQHLRFGPIELFMRGYRMYFWPESRSRVDDSVRQLLAEHPDGKFTMASFSRTSVAVQGLPAAEQLLFVGGERLDGTSEGKARCRLLLAISANLVEIGQGLVTDWTGGQDPFRTVAMQPGPENVYFETPRDVTLAFFKGLHNGLQLIADLRLKPVMGASIPQAQPRLAESTASARSLRNILVSLEGLQAMYVDGGVSAFVRAQPGRQDLDALLLRAFAMTIESAKSLPEPLAKAVTDAKARGAVELLYKRVLALKQIVRSDLADALDVAVGFNALDGD